MISDWIFGIRDAARSVAAGLDVEMPYRMVRADGLRDALKREDVTWEQIDRSIERVLSTLLRFDDVLQQPKPDYDVLALPRAPRARARGRREVGRPPSQRAGRRRAGAAPRGFRAAAGRGARPARVDREPRRRRVERRLGARSRHRAGGLRGCVASRRRRAPRRRRHRSAPHAVAGDADVALVVVGYTYVDEGEYIGDAGVDLRSLCPRRTTQPWSPASRPRPRPDDLWPRLSTCGRGATRAGSRAAATARRCVSAMTRSR